MKVDATQTKPVTVEINDDEIYRITRNTILELIGMQNKVGKYDELEIVDGNLIKVFFEDMGPYGSDRVTEVLRWATNADVNVVAVLEQLKDKQL